MAIIQEFKEFVMRGNVVDLAVGIVIGAAFGTIVNSFVNDVLMPPIGMGLGHVDFAQLKVVLKGATTAPDGSETKPVNSPDPPCANPNVVSRPSTLSRSAQRVRDLPNK